MKDKDDYQELVQKARELNPSLFNNPQKLAEKLAEIEKEIAVLQGNTSYHEAAKSILIQGRNIFAMALGKEIWPCPGD